MFGILRMLAAMVAMKTFLVTVFVTILGVTLYNLISEILEEIATVMVDKLDGIQAPTGQAVAELTGVAGWMGGLLNLDDCLAFIISIVILKFTLRKIPFLKW